MEIKCLGTGSSGNCYIIQTGNFHIMLDCGLKYENIVQSPLFCGFRNLNLVFCSHCHSDHSKSLDKFIDSGVNVISYKDLNYSVQAHTRFYDLTDLDIITFPVKHNVDNWAILIYNKQNKEVICYATDFSKIQYIRGVTHFIYEINWDKATVNQNLLNNNINIDYIENSLNNHNSLENAEWYFKYLDYKLKSIYICHTSMNNANKDVILDKMKKYAKNVKILQKGDTYED